MASEDFNDFEGFCEEDLLSETLGFGLDAQSDISFSSVRTSELSDFCLIDDEEINNSYFLPVEWTESIIQPSPPEEFTSFVGPTKPLGLDATPVEYFFQLFPENLFEEMAFQTNLYAEQQGATNFPPTCSAEVRAYVGMLFRMGCVHVPNYR